MLIRPWLRALRRSSVSSRLIARSRRRRARGQRWIQAAGIERLEDRTLLSGMAPSASNDSYTVVDDNFDSSTEAMTGSSVLANDFDMEFDSLTAVLVSNGSHGSVNLNSNGTFTYSPDQNYTGSDSFTYKAWDGTSYSNTATVSLTVTNMFSTRLNLDDQPSAPATPYGPVAASPFTGDLQLAHAIGGGLTLQYHALSDPRPVVAAETSFTPSTQAGTASGIEAGQHDYHRYFNPDPAHLPNRKWTNHFWSSELA